jgi:hypothetical protein
MFSYPVDFVWPTASVGMLHPFPPEGAEGAAVARGQAIEFLRLAEAAANGVKYSDAKKRFDSVDHAQVETRKALYEELNLLYVPYRSDKLILTPVGEQLLNLVGVEPTAEPSDDLRHQVDSLLAWALSHSQIARPQGSGTPRLRPDVRKLCDVRPYAAFWTALRVLDGWISAEELQRILLYLQCSDDFEKAVDAIREWRETGQLRVSGTPYQPFENQASVNNHRIYWTTHLSIARSLLAVDAGVFKAASRTLALLDAITDLTSACGTGSASSMIVARPFSSLDDYFQHSGMACPPFIGSGKVRLRMIEGEEIAFLGGFALDLVGGDMRIEGEADLCSLKINAPCFHPSQPANLLRLVRKELNAEGHVSLILRPARPILNVEYFVNAEKTGDS